MDFNHTELRQMLGDSLGRYLQQRYPFDERQRIASSDLGWSREHWSALAELGIQSALIKEDLGGFGGEGFDIAAVFEVLGRNLAVEPFLGFMMSACALGAIGGFEDTITDATAGGRFVAFAHSEPQAHYDINDVALEARSDDGHWTLTGHKALVNQGDSADLILVTARVAGCVGDEGRLGLFLVDGNAQGLVRSGYPLIDGGRAAEIAFAATPAQLLTLDGEQVVEAAIAAGVVAVCWEAIGIMDVVKASTLEYLRTRKQFGVPIGKFQALQHRMAEVALEIEQARSAAINAANALSSERGVRERAVSAAKFTIGRVGTLVAEEAIQMHGGIGMTWELPLSHFAKRLIMIDHELGDEDHHLARFIALGADA